jgi:hypothetical protein
MVALVLNYLILFYISGVYYELDAIFVFPVVGILIAVISFIASLINKGSRLKVFTMITLLTIISGFFTGPFVADLLQSRFEKNLEKMYGIEIVDDTVFMLSGDFLIWSKDMKGISLSPKQHPQIMDYRIELRNKQGEIVEQQTIKSLIEQIKKQHPEIINETLYATSMVTPRYYKGEEGFKIRFSKEHFIRISLTGNNHFLLEADGGKITPVLKRY